MGLRVVRCEGHTRASGRVVVGVRRQARQRGEVRSVPSNTRKRTRAGPEGGPGVAGHAAWVLVGVRGARASLG